MIIIPPSLRKGNTIGITCPAGYMAAEKAQTCIKTLQQWGFDVMVGKTLGSKSTNYFSGTDEERADELQAMMDDPDIHAILFGRGGYGMGRIIDQLDFRKFRKNPKWMIGFSDITVMHTHLLKNYRIASIHGPMAGAFNNMKESALYIDSLHKMITGKKTAFQCEAHPFNRKGKVTGQLVGGNLALLSNVIGTLSDFDTKNRILFIEDIGEYLYNADRMLHQLKRAGKFKNIAALIIGGFTDMKDTTIPFGQTIEEIIRDLVSEFDFPVCYGFPVSHGTDNAPLKIGVEYQLTIDKNKSRLKEI